MKAKLFALLMVAFSAVGYGQGKYGATPEDSLNCIQNLSLYQEFYKQKNYKDAKKPWLNAVNTCPKSSKNLYIKGASMYKLFIKKEKDAAQKSLLIDTLMWIYDTRIESFGQKGSVLGRKGTDLLRYGGKEKQEEAYTILKESIELQKGKSERGTIAAYYQAADFMVKAGKLDKSEMLNLYPTLMKYTQNGIQKAQEKGKADKVEKWKTVAGNLETIFLPYATCDALVEIYQPKFAEDNTDIELLENIVKFFEKQDCTDQELFLNASMKLHEQKPSGLSAIGIGVSLLKKERFADALGYFKQAGEIAENDEDKMKAHKYAAQSSLALKQYANAKSYALKMLKIDPNSGIAYMIIGDAYFYGSKTVGENDCMKHGGYWAASAKYYKAKSLDPSLADKIGKKLGQVANQLPTKEDCFFVNITNGQKVNVGGWINETVTVKTR